MRRWLVFIVLLLAACNPERPSASPTLAQEAVPVNLPTQVNASATPLKPIVQPSPIIASATPTTLNVGNFFLQIISPVDEAVVNTEKIILTGITLPGAVVSVDGALAQVDAIGNFQFTLVLEDGPNIIEVVASDGNGAELSETLRVIYEP
jgi:hypothetical protein